MARTSPFSIRLTKDVRDMIEEKAQILRIKPSVLAAMVLRDCTENWVRDYTEEVFERIHGGRKS